MGQMSFGSLFAGIGGFDLGLERAGMTCAWQVDNDDRCQQVLGYHWPDVPRYGGVRDVGRHNLEPIDVIVGGFPCQDLSVAGRRAGLAGERSGLWWEFHRVIAELNPAWVVIENVPGLLSSNGGRDMGTLLRSLGELRYWWAYRCLDAQYDGLAQRRKRVFIVGYTGDVGGLEPTVSRQDASGLAGLPTKVLFESESLPGHPPPGGEAGEKPAYALAASVRGTGDGHGQGWNTTYVTGFDRTKGTDSGRIAGPLRACGARTEGVNDGKADVQCVAFQPRYYTRDNKPGGAPNDIVDITNCHKAGDSAPVVANCFNGYTGGADDNDAQGRQIVAFTVHGEHSTAMTGKGNAAVAFETERARSLDSCGGYATNQGGNVMLAQYGVRRLTPTECERLQGFPDGWTAVDGMSDTARYRMLGNAVAVPVAEWIGRRIVNLDNAPQIW